MAVYTPTVTMYPNGIVEIISLTDTSYLEILQSMGDMNYLLETLYLYCTSQSQLLQPLNFVEYDSNGNIADKKTIPTLDPFQYQNALFIEFNDKKYIFNGRTFIELTIEASQILYIYLGTVSFGNKDFLEKFDFFDTFSEKICI